MRRLLCLFLILILSVGLFACGKEVSESTYSSSSEEAPLTPSSSADEQEDAPAHSVAVKTTQYDFHDTFPGSGTMDFFAYGNTHFAMLTQMVLEGELSEQLYLVFINAKTRTLTEDRIKLGNTEDFLASFNHRDGYYVCFQDVTYCISGTPENDISAQEVEYSFSYEKDDSVITSPDGKWYAFRDEDAVLVNAQTGERIIPYNGIREGNMELHTGSYPAGFVGNLFIFNIVGYEWGNGYGTVDLETGEISVQDNLLDLYTSPSPDATRIPYTVNWLEVGYIDASAPDKLVPIYNVTEDTDSPLHAELGNDYYFSIQALGKDKFLITAETDENCMRIIILDAETLRILHTQTLENYPSYFLTIGDTVAFFSPTVDINDVTIISVS